MVVKTGKKPLSPQERVWACWGGKKSYDLLVSAAKTGEIYELRILKEPATGKPYVSIGYARIPLVAPWAVPPMISMDGKAVTAPFGKTRKVKVLHYTKRYKTPDGERVREFFLVEPAEPKTLPVEEYNTRAQRYMRPLVCKSRDGRIFLKYQGIYLILKDPQVWKQMGVDDFVDKKVYVIGWYAGNTSFVVEPKGDDLDYTEELTVPGLKEQQERQQAEIRDRMKGILAVRDSAGLLIKMAAVSILGFEPHEPLNEKMVKDAWKATLKHIQNNIGENFFYIAGVMLSADSYRQAANEAKDLLLELIKKDFVSFVTPTEVIPPESEEEDPLIEETNKRLDKAEEIMDKEIRREEELKKLSRGQLLKEAKKHNIPNFQRTKSPELIKTILEKEMQKIVK